LRKRRIVGPVLRVIPTADEQQIVAIEKDMIYGANTFVFTNDIERPLAMAGRLRSGTIGENAFRTDFVIRVGGFQAVRTGRLFSAYRQSSALDAMIGTSCYESGYPEIQRREWYGPAVSAGMYRERRGQMTSLV
jgi:acyl-CoA reductase-like NAD-dependent aldehyde dehydrogenase